jgi:hypothetical protein
VPCPVPRPTSSASSCVPGASTSARSTTPGDAAPPDYVAWKWPPAPASASSGTPGSSRAAEGAPSRRVLDAICTALELREDEREHAFVLAFGAPATADPFAGGAQLERTQRVLDHLMPWPAYLKSPTWDVLAWNAASRRFLTDYPSIPATDRNVLRILFTDPTTRERIEDWQEEAKLTVATFRLEQARWNAFSASVDDLVRTLRDESAEFAAIWDLNEVGHLGQGIKRLRVGPGEETVSLHYESMSVDALPGAGIVVYAPVGPRDEHLLDRALRERS